MNVRTLSGAGSVALGVLLFAPLGLPQTQQPTSGKVGAMEWTLVLGGRGGGGGRGAAGAPGAGGAAAGGRAGAGAFPGGGGGGGGFPGGGGRGRGVVLEACTQEAAKICPGLTAGPQHACLSANVAAVSAGCKANLDANPLEVGDTPSCYRSPICGNRITGALGGGKGKVWWKPTLTYTPSQPYKELIKGTGGMVSVGIDSKDNVWGLQRNAAGQPQLFKFSPDGKLLLTVGEDVITHHVKAHGMKVDSQDNVWICDEAAATVKEISPDGKLLKTLGERGHRGDWDEEKGQRLLWEPVMVDFLPNGDMFIFEGHANESPNDVDAPDATNRIGVARVIHLDKNQNFINQIYGNTGGPGKFDSAHGSAVDPQTGVIWIGDREQYRIVQYTSDGKFLRSIPMKNLVCSIYFDRFGGVWTGTGLDGQLTKVDRDGNVIGAVGVTGNGDGSWGESSYLVMDSKGNIFSGDTTRGRITKWTPSKVVFNPPPTTASAAPGR
ncbi:MAG: hypothetical protein ABJC09_01740 [Terriglobia bacterium]